jgi:hypothetical protein
MSALGQKLKRTVNRERLHTEPSRPVEVFGTISSFSGALPDADFLIALLHIKTPSPSPCDLSLGHSETLVCERLGETRSWRDGEF